MSLPNSNGLPENAYRKLNPGENYIPMVPPTTPTKEFTRRSIVLGLIMVFIFSAAAAFLGMKIGQVFETAIPIAILAVGYSGMCKRKSSILENVIVQSIGGASGLVVAGAIFTIPGIFILQLDKDIGISFIKIFITSLAGGVLGLLFLIPFRKYFVSEMHGEFPFPEATATTEILVAGEAGGDDAKILVKSMIIGGIYDFLILTINFFKEEFSTTVTGWGHSLAENTKMLFKIDVLSSILGIGYIVGPRYGAIMCAGSLLSWWIFIPLVNYFSGAATASMSPEMIFSTYVRHIGIGCIATAGIIGVIKSSKVIQQAVTTGMKGVFKKHDPSNVQTRTNIDLKMSTIAIMTVILAVVIFLFFRFSVLGAYQVSTLTRISIIALLVVFIISFMFTSVAARAIAIVGSNPVSGMTLMTLIISSIILAGSGLTGRYGMLAALLIGGVVCTSLSMAGGFITDLKIGYWLGSTPKKQQQSKLLGTLVAAAAVGFVVLLLNNTYGFIPIKNADTNALVQEIKTMNVTSLDREKTVAKLQELSVKLGGISAPSTITSKLDKLIKTTDENEFKAGLDKFLVAFDASQPLPAPQANAMSAVIKPLMEKKANTPWLLYSVGALLALILELVSIPPLAFALGIYLPLQLNTPMLLGGTISLLVQRSTKDRDLSTKRQNRGILIASGFIAGGAIMGVVSTLIKFANQYVPIEDAMHMSLGDKPAGEWLSLFMLIGLCVYLYVDSKRVKS
jgi:putative OPT family oligopeptide transporter